MHSVLTNNLTDNIENWYITIINCIGKLPCALYTCWEWTMGVRSPFFIFEPVYLKCPPRILVLVKAGPWCCGKEEGNSKQLTVLKNTWPWEQVESNHFHLRLLLLISRYNIPVLGMRSQKLIHAEDILPWTLCQAPQHDCLNSASPAASAGCHKDQIWCFAIYLPLYICSFT